jgi:hypothetical protein
MKGRNLLLSVLAAGLALGTTLPARATEACIDPTAPASCFVTCDDEGWVVCVNDGFGDPVVSVHQPHDAEVPTFAPVALPVELAPAVNGDGRLVATNTCRYAKTYFAEGDSSPDRAQASLSAYGSDDSLGSYALSYSHAEGVLPTTVSDYANSRTGVRIYLNPKWPQPSSVTVNSPWAIRGSLFAETALNPVTPAAAQAAYTLDYYLTQGSLNSNTQLSTDEAAVNIGQQSITVKHDGTASLNVSTPADQTYKAYLQLAVTTSAASLPAVSSTAEANFWMTHGGAFLNYQDWVFSIPAGYVVTSC